MSSPTLWCYLSCARGLNWAGAFRLTGSSIHRDMKTLMRIESFHGVSVTKAFRSTPGECAPNWIRHRTVDLGSVFLLLYWLFHQRVRATMLLFQWIKRYCCSFCPSIGPKLRTTRTFLFRRGWILDAMRFCLFFDLFRCFVWSFTTNDQTNFDIRT